MASPSSFALANRQKTDAAGAGRSCLRKEEPTKDWILSADSLPPHAPAGLRVLYATTSLELLAVLNCHPEMPDVLLHSPRVSRYGNHGQSKTLGSKLAVYHLVTPEFVCWLEEGLSHLGEQVIQEREAFAKVQAAAGRRSDDDLPGAQELKLRALQSQLDDGLQRWEALAAWRSRFMRPSPARQRDAERLVREHSWEPRRVRWPEPRPAPGEIDADFRGLCWEEVGGPWGWAVDVPGSRETPGE